METQVEYRGYSRELRLINHIEKLSKKRIKFPPIKRLTGDVEELSSRSLLN